MKKIKTYIVDVNRNEDYLSFTLNNDVGKYLMSFSSWNLFEAKISTLQKEDKNNGYDDVQILLNYKNDSQNIVYFELNNWTPGKDYPNDEPFKSWIGNDLKIRFYDEKWIKENKLCIVNSLIDMSSNFCITATEDWVKKNCPKLLTEYKEFLRYPNEDNEVYGRFGDEFLEYDEENFGIRIVEED